MSLAQGNANSIKRWLNMVMNSLRFTKVSTSPTGAADQSVIYLNSGNNLAVKTNGNTEQLIAVSGGSSSLTNLTLTGASEQLILHPGGSGNAYTVSVSNPGQNTEIGILDPGVANCHYVVDNDVAAVVQATSLNTAVTCNSRAFAITMFSALPAGGGGSFTLNNNRILGAQSILILVCQNTHSLVDFISPTVEWAPIGAGQALISVNNSDAANATAVAPTIYGFII